MTREKEIAKLTKELEKLMNKYNKLVDQFKNKWLGEGWEVICHNTSSIECRFGRYRFTIYHVGEFTNKVELSFPSFGAQNLNTSENPDYTKYLIGLSAMTKASVQKLIFEKIEPLVVEIEKVSRQKWELRTTNVK